MVKLLKLLLKNRKTLFGAVLGLSVGLLALGCVILHRTNKKLVERLEMASNSIEAYEGIIAGNTVQNNTLLLTVDLLLSSNDRLLQLLDSVIGASHAKELNVGTAATQTQNLVVNGGKGVEVDLIEVLKDTTYTDSLLYNPLTKVYYTIGVDTVSVALDVQNTQYLYTYREKQWKNKKNFIKRLFTLDFKKVWKNKYEIVNTNDLLNTSDVRVIEIVN